MQQLSKNVLHIIQQKLESTDVWVLGKCQQFLHSELKVNFKF